jgi:hypothetical protein
MDSLYLARRRHAVCTYGGAEADRWIDLDSGGDPGAISIWFDRFSTKHQLLYWQFNRESIRPGIRPRTAFAVFPCFGRHHGFPLSDKGLLPSRARWKTFSDEKLP